MGLFRICKIMTMNGLRILCYHSFSKKEGVEWLPDLFICPKTLSKRLDFLTKNNFRVIKLDQATDLLTEKKVPPLATVITVDDGWVPTKTIANKIFQRYRYPYTVYITSYYSQKQSPVFNMVVKYMFWKTDKRRVSFKKLHFIDLESAEISDKTKINRIMLNIVKFGQEKLNNEQRHQLMVLLGEILNVNYYQIIKKRFLNILSDTEIKELSEEGVDFQLHTHTHRLPVDKEKFFWEIEQNRSYLKNIIGDNLKHLCFPDGHWLPEQIENLNAACIKSATTCEAGINYSNTQNLYLKRFVDSQAKFQIQFEAEVCGFLDIYNKFKRRLKHFSY